ncbi:Uncharacterized protein Adt_16601 [Abeliophyllum distichum]|uniref:Uncharacterized protein n=1 Tax=Abeliophyllum distichum TaxID=126358 RepID=A0ABD1TE78_9LAMI
MKENGHAYIGLRSDLPILIPIPPLKCELQTMKAAWKRLKHIDPQAETHRRRPTLLGSYGVSRYSFGINCWMGESILADQHPHLTHSSIQVGEFFDDTGWNIGRHIQLVPYIIAEQLGNIPNTAAVHDHIAWKNTSNGRFATKSA